MHKTMCWATLNPSTNYRMNTVISNKSTQEEGKQQEDEKEEATISWHAPHKSQAQIQHCYLQTWTKNPSLRVQDAQCQQPWQRVKETLNSKHQSPGKKGRILERLRNDWLQQLTKPELEQRSRNMWIVQARWNFKSVNLQLQGIDLIHISGYPVKNKV